MTYCDLLVNECLPWTLWKMFFLWEVAEGPGCFPRGWRRWHLRGWESTRAPSSLSSHSVPSSWFHRFLGCLRERHRFVRITEQTKHLIQFAVHDAACIEIHSTKGLTFIPMCMQHKLISMDHSLAALNQKVYAKPTQTQPGRSKVSCNKS